MAAPVGAVGGVRAAAALALKNCNIVFMCVTWRGAAGKDVAESGRYYNKGMRIDLFMVQHALLRRVEQVEVCGRGADMVGFLGSDHSPVMLRMGEGEAAAAALP